MENWDGPLPDSPENKPIGRILLDAISEGILSVVLFCFRFVGWSVRWTLATACFLAIMAGAAWFVFNEAVEGGGHVPVPNVVGMDVTQAQYILAEAGLEIGKQTQIKSDLYPQYHVVLQRPAANKVVREGRSVSLTISAGDQFLTTPDVRGRSLEEARQQLEQQRLLLGAIAHYPSNEPKDQILAQDPPPGTQSAVGGEVHVLLSDGPRDTRTFMPDLIGMTHLEAQSVLAALDVETTVYAVDREGEEYNIVLDQEPEPGTVLQKGQEVKYDIRPMSGTEIPTARRRQTAAYVVPPYAANPEVRVDIVDHRRNRGTVFPEPSQYTAGLPPRFSAGTKIQIPFSFQNEATVEFFLDGRLDASYHYEGDAEPIITRFAPASTAETDTAEPLIQVFEPTSTRIAPAQPVLPPDE